MKELLRTNDRQTNYLGALSRTLITARGAQQILESHPDSTAMIRIEDLKLNIDVADVSMFHGGARGLYNELAHPLIEKGQEKVRYFRGTDKKMRGAALKIIDEAKNASFETQKT